jgi:hypothetical protein
MPCACKAKAMRNTTPRTGNTQPVVGNPRLATTQGIAAGPSPLQVRQAAAAIANNHNPTPPRSPAGMNHERRLVEKKRRDAIRNALGKV